MEDDRKVTDNREDQTTSASDSREVDAALVQFPFDRMTAQRFRQTFPRARWSDQVQAWTVPGKTARRRIDRWLALEAARTDSFAEERGRDAYAFEPILSPYLEVDDDGFRIRTPYSRTAVDELRQIAFARWDSNHRVWRVPFASYEDLQHRWETIEKAARRNEPEERRRRAEARRGTEEELISKRRAAERRRRRLPVRHDHLPPLQRPIATSAYGIVVIKEITGELVNPVEVKDLYPDLCDEHVWCHWRMATHEELIHTWPAKSAAGKDERVRDWWQPTIEELREARRSARSRERRQSGVAAAGEQ